MKVASDCWNMQEVSGETLKNPKSKSIDYCQLNLIIHQCWLDMLYRFE